MKNEENIKSFTLKVYPSEEARFRKIVEGMDDIDTLRDGLTKLMDNYEFPKTVQVDNPELIKKNQELADEIDELQETIASQKAELTRHQEEAQQAEAQKVNRPENHLEVEVHPVAFEFLKKMAAYQTKVKGFEVTPGDILVNLFLCDLQNPRANNLPYIVPTSEIRAKLEEYKKQHPEEYEHKR